MTVFDEAFVATMVGHYRSRRASQRPDLYFVTTSPQRAELRAWVEAEILHVPQPGRSKLTTRLRKDESFLTAYHELAAAAVLRAAGYGVEYEPDLGGATPDFLVKTSEGQPALIVDVWTRQLPQGAKGAKRLWNDLCHRIADIPVGVFLLIRHVGGAEIAPPTGAQTKAIATHLRQWLLGAARPVGSEIDVEGYRFAVAGNAPGLRAQLAPPEPGGWVDSDVVLAAIREKTHKYGPIADKLGLGFMTVLAADPLAPLDLGEVVMALAGKLVFSMSIPLGANGPLQSWRTQLRRDDTLPGFRQALSAVGYLDVANHTCPHLTVIPVASSNRPLIPLEASCLRVLDDS